QVRAKHGAVQRPAAVAASPAPGFRATDDGFEGHSLSITCEASAEGVRFVPAEAGVSSDSLALGYALGSVRAGDHSFFARESAAQPELERYDTILFRHPGGVEERYHVRATGIRGEVPRSRHRDRADLRDRRRNPPSQRP
ncbi:MAG: hypothetical protein ACYTFT_17240, partial [Planctomycetota bacterium]